MNYLQFNDRGKFEPEEQALANYFGEGNYTGFYKKHFLRDKFQITKNDFISGDIDVMFHAMKRLGIEYSYNDYPECLKPYLHRKIWESTLGEVRKRLFDDLGNEVELGLNWFIKPKDKLKRFTGFVCETIDDLSKCAGAGNQTKIWCSEPVTFVDEFRIYRLQYHDSALTTYSVGCHKKDFNFQNLEKVDFFIKNLPWGLGLDLPVACAIDVGILPNDEVALIEVNDAFSLGLYKNVCLKNKKESLEYDKFYCECLIARWEELKKEN
jgi:hypothetical protein